MTAADESWTKRAHSVHSMGAGAERGACNERAPSMHARLNFFSSGHQKNAKTRFCSVTLPPFNPRLGPVYQC